MLDTDKIRQNLFKKHRVSCVQRNPSNFKLSVTVRFCLGNAKYCEKTEDKFILIVILFTWLTLSTPKKYIIFCCNIL